MILDVTTFASVYYISFITLLIVIDPLRADLTFFSDDFKRALSFPSWSCYNNGIRSKIYISWHNSKREKKKHLLSLGVRTQL